MNVHGLTRDIVQIGRGGIVTGRIIEPLRRTGAAS